MASPATTTPCLKTASSSSSAVQPLTSFHLFSQLANEMQLLIFSHALPSSRTVNLYWESKTLTPYSTTPPPLLLHVNSLSRKLVLEYHIPLFSPSSGLPIIYINTGLDTLRIHSPPLSLRKNKNMPKVSYISNIFSTFSPSVSSNLKYITIDRRLWSPSFSHCSAPCHSLQSGIPLLPFRNLQTLTMLISYSHHPLTTVRKVDRVVKIMEVLKMVGEYQEASTANLTSASDGVKSGRSLEGLGGEKANEDLYCTLRFVRRFGGLHDIVAGLELTGKERRKDTQETVMADLEVLGMQDRAWRIPALTIIGCVGGQICD